MSITIEVVAHALNERSGPSTGYSVLQALGQGQQAIVDNFAYDQWLHVTSPSPGYVYPGSRTKPNVQPISIVITPPPGPTSTFQVETTTDLNVRSTPVIPPANRTFDKSFNYLFTLKANTMVTAEKLVGGWYKLAGVEQYINAAYAVPVTQSTPPQAPPVVPPVVIPPNQPNLPWNLPFSATQRGVHGNAGGWSPSPTELALIARNHIETILLVAYNRAVAILAVPALRRAGISHFILRAETTEKPTTVQRFLDLTVPILREYADALGGTQDMMIAIHNEPNVVQEGLGSAWNNGTEFAAWWTAVAQVYRNLFPGCKLGFPAVSPGGTEPGVRVDSVTFVQQAVAALRAADWIGVHEYWQHDDGSDFNPPINTWRQVYGNKPLVGTEIGPVNAGVVTPVAVEAAYNRLAAAGVPVMAWILNGSGSYSGADWTAHNLTLANPNSPPPQQQPPTNNGTEENKTGLHIEGSNISDPERNKMIAFFTRLKNAGHPMKSAVVVDDIRLFNALAGLVDIRVFRSWPNGQKFDPSQCDTAEHATAHANWIYDQHWPIVSQLVGSGIVVQFRNEKSAFPHDTDFELQLAKRADADGRFKVGMFADSLGGPEIDQWETRESALAYAMAHDHYAIGHNYGAEVNNKPADVPVDDPTTWPWYGGRFIMLEDSVPANCRPKWIFGESGMSDALPHGQRSIDDIKGTNKLLQAYPEAVAINYYGYGNSMYGDDVLLDQIEAWAMTI